MRSNRAMAEGAVSPELPWVHKKGLELLKANYHTEAEARAKIPDAARRPFIAPNIPTFWRQSRGW